MIWHAIEASHRRRAAGNKKGAQRAFRFIVIDQMHRPVPEASGAQGPSLELLPDAIRVLVRRLSLPEVAAGAAFSALLLGIAVRLLRLLGAIALLRRALVHLRLGRCGGAIATVAVLRSGSRCGILAAMAVQTTLASGFPGFGRGELMGGTLGVGGLASHAGDLALFLPIHGGEAAIAVPRIL